MTNVARLPRAAETLRTQVLEIKTRSKVERHGEPDGFNVYRSVIFNKATSTWLEPILSVIEDPRIAALSIEGDGRLVVTFVADRRADSTEPFPLTKVADVLQGA